MAFKPGHAEKNKEIPMQYKLLKKMILLAQKSYSHQSIVVNV
jgi:hypothetical protein